MTADMFTLLQSYANVQTMQPIMQETPPDGTGIQSGLFASLMNECIAEGECADFPAQRFADSGNMVVIPENTSELHTVAFTGSRSFPQSVMSILAGESEPESAETTLLSENELTSQKTPDYSDIVIWPEDEAAMKPESIRAEKEPPAENVPHAENELPPLNETPAVSEPHAGSKSPANIDIPADSEIPAETENKLPQKSEFPAKNESPAKSELPAENEPIAENESPADRVITRVRNLVQEKSHTADITDLDVQEISEQVIAEEGLDYIPEGLKQETSHILNDFAAELRHDEDTDTQLLVRILEAVTAQTAPKSPDAPAKSANIPDETEDSHEHEQTPEILEVITDFAVAAETANSMPKTTEQSETSGQSAAQDIQLQPEHHAAESQPVSPRRPQTETHSQPVMSIPAEQTDPKPETMPIPENVLTSPETPDDSDIVIWPENEQARRPESIPSENEPVAENESPADRVITRVKNLVQEKSHTADITDSDVQETAEQVIAEEGLDELPEGLKHETSLVLNDFAAELKREDDTDTQPIVRILEAITAQTAPKSPEAPAKSANTTDETEDSPEPHELPEIPEGITEFAGLAGITNPQPKTSGQPLPETQPQIHRTRIPHEHQQQESQPVRPQRPRTEVQDSQLQPEHRTEESQPDRPQSPHPETHQQLREHQEPQTSGQTQNQSKLLKPETRPQKTEQPAQKSEPVIRKTESRSDFAAFFEGVLTSRRSTSRTSAPMPLNLRTAESFPQAQSVRLREGITNVVRFIRADGVQKARVVIDPPALGRVSVELTSGTSGVEASIKVASEQIRQLVQEQISQLRMNLSQQGVQVSEFTVDVQQDNSGNHGQQGQQQNTSRFGFMDDSDDDEAEDFRIDLDEGLLYWVA